MYRNICFPNVDEVTLGGDLCVIKMNDFPRQKAIKPELMP